MTLTLSVLLNDASYACPSSSLSYCHRLDDHPPRHDDVTMTSWPPTTSVCHLPSYHDHPPRHDDQLTIHHVRMPLSTSSRPPTTPKCYLDRLNDHFASSVLQDQYCCWTRRVHSGPTSGTGCWTINCVVRPMIPVYTSWRPPTTFLCYQDRLRRGARGRPRSTQVAGWNRWQFDVIIDVITAAWKNWRLLQPPASISVTVDLKLSRNPAINLSIKVALKAELLQG